MGGGGGCSKHGTPTVLEDATIGGRAFLGGTADLLFLFLAQKAGRERDRKRTKLLSTSYEIKIESGQRRIQRQAGEGTKTERQSETDSKTDGAIAHSTIASRSHFPCMAPSVFAVPPESPPPAVAEVRAMDTGNSTEKQGANTSESRGDGSKPT
jgi:hypothetical protein